MVQCSTFNVVQKAREEFYQIPKSDFSYIQERNEEFPISAKLSNLCYETMQEKHVIQQTNECLVNPSIIASQLDGQCRHVTSPNYLMCDVMMWWWHVPDCKNGRSLGPPSATFKSIIHEDQLNLPPSGLWCLGAQTILAEQLTRPLTFSLKGRTILQIHQTIWRKCVHLWMSNISHSNISIDYIQKCLKITKVWSKHKTYLSISSTILYNTTHHV